MGKLLLIHQDHQFLQCNQRQNGAVVLLGWTRQSSTPPAPHLYRAGAKNTVFPPPETKTFQLEDGSIRVEVGEFWKVVSSWHLTEVAENQLIQAYREHYTK